MIDWLREFAPQDRVLAGISIAVAALLAVALLFAIVTSVLRVRNVLRMRTRRSLELRWEPIVLDVLAGDVDPAAAWQRVAARERRFFTDYLLRYVKRFQGAERRLVRELARPLLPELVRQLSSRRPEQRARAVQSLALLSSGEQDALIVRALDDESTMVALVTARTLASKEHTRFAPELLRRLSRFRGWSSTYISSMLSAMGSEIVPALRAILEDDSRDEEERRIAADALYDLDDIASADVAARIASSDAGRDLRAATLRLLGRVGRGEHAPVARAGLASDDALIRQRAAEAMLAVAAPEDLIRLRGAIEDDSVWVAIAAARALLGAGGRRLLEELAASEAPRALLAREILEEAA